MIGLVLSVAAGLVLAALAAFLAYRGGGTAAPPSLPPGLEEPRAARAELAAETVRRAEEKAAQEKSADALEWLNSFDDRRAARDRVRSSGGR